MSSSQRRSSKATRQAQHYGIRAPTKLVWRRWVIGEEYTKILEIANTMPFSMRITYRPPEKIIKHDGQVLGSVFSTIYPKPILLSAGTTFSIPVSFRPMSYMLFEDDVEFTVTLCDTESRKQKKPVQTDYTFKVNLRAVLPEAKIKVPRKVSIEPCAVLDCGVATFSVSNPSEDTSICVNFDVGLPFSVQTNEIMLDPQSSQTVTVKFEPQRAGLFNANIKCHYYNREAADTNQPKNIQTKRIYVHSCSKYPHLICPNSLDFGNVPLGKSKTKSIVIKNMGTVPTPISVEPVIMDDWQRANAPFVLSNASTVLGEYGGPNDSCKIQITYTPHQSEQVTVRSYKIIACGSLSFLKLKCIGEIQRPEVVSIINNTEDCNTLDFGMAEVGHLYKLRVTLYNKSDAAAYYTLSGLDIMSDDHYEENVFHMGINENPHPKDEDLTLASGASGVLEGKSRRSLIVNFRPQFPMAYYRRVALLVHQQEPQFITLMGTARSASEQPAVLEESHVINARQNEFNGIDGLPPTMLYNKIGQNKLRQDPKIPGQLTCASNAVSVQANTPYTSTFDEFFDDGTVDDLSYLPPELQLSSHAVDFGKCDTNKTYSQTISITNNTSGEVTVVWSKSRLFQVDPLVTEIPPKSAARFRIITRITEADKFFGKKLECYGCYTEQLDYRKVPQHLIQPSWHADLTVTANSFLGSPYSATVRFSEKIINLPALSPGRSTYGTFILENHDTSTPVLYNLKLDDEVSKKTGYCIVKPTTALVQASYEVLVVRLKATPDITHPSLDPTPIDQQNLQNRALSALPLRSNLKFTFNASNQFHALTVQGFAAWPTVQLPNTLYFRPTCVGTSSERTSSIQNRSPLSISFAWVVSDVTHASVLEISPSKGKIQAGDVLDFRVRFSPKTAGDYEIKAKLFIFCSDTEYNESFFMTCHARASEGRLCIQNPKINLGSVIVGRPIEYTMPLINKAECDVPWRIWLQEENQRDCGIHVNPMTGVLPAKAKCDVNVTITSHHEGQLNFSCISSCATNLHENVSHSRLKKQQKKGDLDKFNNHAFQSLGSLTMSAVYPVVKIVSVSGHDQSEGLSSQHLERWLDVAKFNNVLVDKCGSSNVPRTEDELNNATPDIRMSLGAAPQMSSSNMVTHICFKNVGSVHAAFKVILPKDVRVKTPHWASPDIMPQGNLMHGLKVEESRLFSFSPSQGTLQPDEEVTIKISYDPRKIPGKNVQRIAFALDGGPCVVADIYAISVPKNQPYLHLMPVHQLQPTTCCGNQEQLQHYPIFNGSNIPVEYTIEVCDDTAEEFGEDVLACATPKGIVAPGTFVNVPFAFTPLEAREYAMDILVGIEGQEKRQVVTLLGEGTLDQVQHTNALTTNPLTAYTKSGLQMELSDSLIGIGKVPLYSRVTKTVFLKNNHPHKAVLYRFTQFDAQIITINAAEGRLDAGEYATLTVVYEARPPARVFYDAVNCEVVFEEESFMYKKQMREFKEAKKRAEHEFTIEDKSLPTTAMPMQKRRTTGHHKPAEPRTAATTATTFQRTETVPPINSRASRYRKPTKSAGAGDSPIVEAPPKPDVLLLHLTLIGESEIASNLARGLTFFNIREPSRAVQQTSSSDIYEGEPEIMEDLMGDLVHDILYGSDLLSNIGVLDRVEPPFYAHLNSTKNGGPAVSRENTEPNLFKTILQHDQNVISEKSIPDIPALKMTTELLEDTIKNIMTDAVQEEFLVTAPHRFFSNQE